MEKLIKNKLGQWSLVLSKGDDKENKYHFSDDKDGPTWGVTGFKSIDHALQSSNRNHRLEAIHHPDFKEKHVRRALKDSDPHIREAAQKRLDNFKEHASPLDNIKRKLGVIKSEDDSESED